MRVNFSDMPDYDLVQRLFDADTMSAKLIILGAPDDVFADSESEVERLYEQVVEMYGDDEEELARIRLSMPGIHILMKHIDKQESEYKVLNDHYRYGVHQ